MLLHKKFSWQGGLSAMPEFATTLKYYIIGKDRLQGENGKGGGKGENSRHYCGI